MKSTEIFVFMNNGNSKSLLSEDADCPTGIYTLAVTFKKKNAFF